MSPSLDGASLAEIEGFVRDMRELGAAKVRVGPVEVTFDLPLVELSAPAPAEAGQDAKKIAEKLLYGSSD